MCSYCGCSSLTVVGRFMNEHEQLVGRLAALRRAVATDDRSAVRAAADHLAELLDRHTAAEEAGLFTVLREDAEFTEHIDSLCGEHASLDDQLATIRAGVDEIEDVLQAFVVALRNHMDREDNGLFPAAAIALSGPAWERVEGLTPAAS
jgi:hemerythrin-like domain-containing protein